MLTRLGASSRTAVATRVATPSACDEKVSANSPVKVTVWASRCAKGAFSAGKGLPHPPNPEPQRRGDLNCRDDAAFFGTRRFQVRTADVPAYYSHRTLR